MAPNKALILEQYPTGFPIPGTDLVIKATEFDPKAPPPEGGLILKTNYVSYDPYLRGRMKAPTPASYASSFVHGEPIYNFAISTVVSSSSPRYKAGDVVLGTSNFQEYVTVAKERADSTDEAKAFKILDNPLGLDPKVFLGALGMSGLTAYSSFYEIGKPKKGQTIFISAASGAVGQIVGQLAKREGLKVLGSVGSDQKLKYIKEELGFDGGFNYKSEEPAAGLKRLLGELGSSGLDIYYDNVGGEHLDAAIATMNTFGSIST
jgi:NADPH-dependent curcumin reductase CurA